MPDADPSHTMTLEAFADTIIPGEKRSPDDRAIAGAAEGGGAVAAGAVEMLRHPAGGLAESLEGLMHLLNAHALAYASENDRTLDEAVPPFVALSFADRSALIGQLTAPEHPEKAMWVGMALFSNMAYDSAAHMSTTEALEAGHPGLTSMGYAKPDPDGLWRFPKFSYGRALSTVHPLTTANGSLA